MAIAGFATLFLLSLVTLFFARRGRKIDDHPLCRKCGFDLTGRPVDSERCPECGQQLSSKAIRIGHRRPRRGLSMVAALLLIVSIVGGGVNVFRRNIPWYHYAPCWYVLRQATSVDSAVRARAILELQYRFVFTTLNASQRVAVVDTAIGYQNDPKKPWDDAFRGLISLENSSKLISELQWNRYVDSLIQQATIRTGDRRSMPAISLANIPDGQITFLQQEKLIDALLAYQGDTGTAWTVNVGATIETYRSNGRVTDAQWQRYAKQAWPGAFVFHARGKIRQGDHFPLMQPLQRATRSAPNSVLSANIYPAHLHFQAGNSVQDPLGFNAQIGRSNGGSGTSTLFLPDGMKVGEQSATLSGQVNISDDSHPSKVVATDTFRQELPFELLPVDQSSVRMIHDPSLADKIRQSIHWSALLKPKSSAGWSSDESTELMIRDCPVDLSFEVFVFNAAGKKLRLGSFAVPAGNGGFGWSFCLPVDEKFGPTSDVILVGGPGAASETIDRTAGWDGEIVLKNLPIVLSK